MNERRARPGLALLLASGLAAAAQPAQSQQPELQRRLEALISEPEYARALWGLEVRELDGGRVLAGHGAERLVQPASTMKLLTTAAALDAFGPAARFATTLESAGRVDAAGRLLGDLYLVGGGDLGLSRRFGAGRALAGLETLADALAAAGVERVEGRLVGHDGLFQDERRPEGWDWDDLVWWYGAEVSALSFADNSAELRARPGRRVGAPLLVEREPVSSYYQVESSAVTGARGSKPALQLRRELGGNQIVLSGTWPLGAAPWKGSVALENPPLYAATAMREVLERRGIAVLGPAVAARLPLPEGRRVLAQHQGPSLAELLPEVNKESLNLHAEVLLRLLGVHATGVGSLQAGREALQAFLRRQGVDPDPWSIRDGSGLSEADLVSASGLVGLLVAMDRHPHAGVFRDSLPIAGADGTLERRLRGAATRGRVRAKTGSLRHVNALAGYATTASGRRLAFAFVLNHYTGQRGRSALDRLVAAIVSDE